MTTYEYTLTKIHLNMTVLWVHAQTKRCLNIFLMTHVTCIDKLITTTTANEEQDNLMTLLLLYLYIHMFIPMSTEVL